MTFCEDHWSKLREAIKKRGLYHLVARSGEEATERIKAELEHKETDATYDPLMACYWMISGKALELGGLAMLGDICPVCEAIKHGATESFWIDGPADAVLQECKKKGLIPTPGVEESNGS